MNLYFWSALLYKSNLSILFLWNDQDFTSIHYILWQCFARFEHYCFRNSFLAIQAPLVPGKCVSWADLAHFRILTRLRYTLSHCLSQPGFFAYGLSEITRIGSRNKWMSTSYLKLWNFTIYHLGETFFNSTNVE